MLTRLLPLLLPALLSAAVATGTGMERSEADGVVTERMVVRRANDLRGADIKGFIQVRLGDNEDWLVLPLDGLTEIRFLSRRESLLVWERPHPKERVLRRELVVPDEVMKTEAVRHLVSQARP